MSIFRSSRAAAPVPAGVRPVVGWGWGEGGGGGGGEGGVGGGGGGKRSC